MTEVDQRRDPGPKAASQVGFLLTAGFALMSYASAVEPLRAANQISGRRLYRWWHASPGNQPAIASNGAAVLPDRPLESEPDAVDIVLVCAGGNPATFDDAPTFNWLRRLARRGVTMGGISGGPYLLARAGLLNGRRCTIHWEHAPAFAETFPQVELCRSLFEVDRARITCSGGIAALDMMIAMIARDHGKRLANAVSEWFLHTHVRDGVLPQRLDLRERRGAADGKLAAALRAMQANLEHPLPREALASLACTSLRQLERSFRTGVGRGVHEHYLALRLGRARQLLRESSLPIVEVAVATGFGSASQFSRAYRRAFGVQPSQVRRWARSVNESLLWDRHA
jgi:transcriptional regulator GlxA family with amidase domain